MASAIIDLADLEENGDNKNNISELRVSELISSLKSSSRADDFAKVEAYLLAKEEKSRMKIETLKQKFDWLLSKYEDERLRNANLAGNLKKNENELSKLRVLTQRNESSDERFGKFLEELKRMGEKEKEILKRMGDKDNEIIDLRSRNIELEWGEAKAEDELKIFKKRFEELESRVVKIESDLLFLSNQQGLKSNGTEDENGAVKVSKVSIDLSCGSPTKANGHSGNAACMPGNGKPSSQNIVEVVDIDSDEGSAPGESPGGENGTADLKRKRTSSIDAGEHVNDDISLNDKLKMKKSEEPVCKPDDCPLNHCSMKTAASDSFGVHRGLVTPNNDNMVSRPHEQQPECEQKSQSIMNGFPLDGLDFLEGSSCSSDSDSEDDNDGLPVFFNHSQLAPESQSEKRN